MEERQTDGSLARLSPTAFTQIGECGQNKLLACREADILKSIIDGRFSVEKEE